ncbi:PH domain-containing protein [Candidatus Saccharibacteria bacterium]|nr:PH domain-containing protein [Candidatus Saccharibacteria bacterium]
MDENLAKIRHERSVKDFPGLKLDEGEYVEFFFKRAKICLKLIWWATFTGMVIVLLGFLIVLLNQEYIDEMGRRFLFIILGALLTSAVIIWLLALKMYNGNKLYITNKHVTQMTMSSPVSTSINIIDLKAVEDASFRQKNIFQKIFRYGTLRLSTVGDETTYTFPYSDISTDDLRAVTELISAAKATHGNEKE